MRGVDDFERALKLEGKTARTINAYRSRIVEYMRWTTARRLGVNKESVFDFLIELQDKGKRPSTLKHYHVVLKRYFKFIGVEFPKELKTPKVDLPPPKYLEKDELRHLYAVSKDDPRDQALLALDYCTGGRIEEILTRQRRHFRFNGKVGEVFIHGKTEESTDAWLPLDEVTVKALRRYLAWVEALEAEAGITSWSFQDYVFHRPFDRKRPMSYQTANKHFKRMCQRAGFKNWKHMSWHWIRHTRATHLLDDGVDPVHIKNQLRHKSLNTTLRYMHTDAEKMRKATAKSDIANILGEKPYNIKKSNISSKRPKKADSEPCTVAR